MEPTGVFFGIASSGDWARVEPVEKGWSSDRKYRVWTKSGESRLLRLSDADRYEEKAREFRVIEKFSRIGFEMSAPIEFGVCDGGRNVYMLLSWVEGRDMESALPRLSEGEQYLLGRKAGGILRRIHALPLAEEDALRGTKKARKLEQLARYEGSELRIPGDETAIRYVRDNIDEIWKAPPAYLHGDFHPGNLICMEGGDIGVIDFNRWEVGDPYEEFYKLQSFAAGISVPYCAGQIDAYFAGDIPEGFWRANAVYVAQASLFSIKWAEPFGREEVDGMVRRARAAFADFDGFARIIPKWYTTEYREKYWNLS